MDPEVTVLMPVYNGETYLQEAIDSILGQTYRDFEFLIIDDASTDKTPEIIRSYDDPRIRTHRNPENYGLARSLNTGLHLSKGKYVARMDADDISLPRRLEKQVAFMEARPETGVCGAWLKMTEDRRNTVLSPPVDHESIRAGLLFENTVFHPTAIIRKETVLALGEVYDERYRQAQDLEYWVRLAGRGVRFANIGEVLLKYRVHGTNTGTLWRDAQEYNADRIRRAQLDLLGIPPDKDEFSSFLSLGKGTSADPGTLAKISTLLQRMRAANTELRIYPEPAFSRELARRFFRVCLHSSGNGFFAWNAYFESPVAACHSVPFAIKMFFFTRCLLHVQHG